MKKLIYLTFFSCLLLCILSSCNSSSTVDYGVEPAQVTPEGLAWYKIEDLEQMKNVKGKKVLVDMYTSWCGWCKVMDKKTFTDPQVVQYLNEHFVLVKFNAERKDTITFQGKTYEWIPRGKNGINKLAYKMMSGRAAYPTMVYLDDNFEVITYGPGYKTAVELMEDLKQVNS